MPAQSKPKADQRPPVEPIRIPEGTAEPTLEEQIACVAREIKLRESAYARWVSDSKMKRSDAEKELSRMNAVLRTLQRLRDAERGKEA